MNDNQIEIVFASSLCVEVAQASIKNPRITNTLRLGDYIGGYEIFLSFKAKKTVGISPGNEFSMWMGKKHNIQIERSSFCMAYLLKDGKDSIVFWREELKKYLEENPAPYEEVVLSDTDSLEFEKLTKLIEAIKKKPCLYLGYESVESFAALLEGMIQSEKHHGKSNALEKLINEIEREIQSESGCGKVDYTKILLIEHAENTQLALTSLLNRMLVHLQEIG